MGTISSGIRTLDNLVDSLRMGDNVVWEVDATHNRMRCSENYLVS